jgi:hypothetical protein
MPLANIFGWDRLLLEGQTAERIQSSGENRPDAFSGVRNLAEEITPRWVLQYFGTEVMSRWICWIPYGWTALIARYRGQEHCDQRYSFHQRNYAQFKINRVEK